MKIAYAYVRRAGADYDLRHNIQYKSRPIRKRAVKFPRQ